MSRTPVLLILVGLIGAFTVASRAEDAPPEAANAPQTLPNTRPFGLDQAFQNLDADQQQRMLRFSTFVNGQVAEEYAEADNTVGYTVRGIVEGGKLYAMHCRQCHGRLGLGNGDLSQALKPSPAMLAYLVGQSFAVDQYLLWSIAEGGKPFGTAMPAFKDRLTTEQIFAIVAYLRADLPALEDSPVPTPGSEAVDADEVDPEIHDID
ncbi:MAG: cytochrome c [Methyloceanibacter sp.]|nr:cytochrome c [Methyloceanibacter sp.]